jgi:Raf kinase inhibitor-like YbhB/YbcL family protein
MGTRRLWSIVAISTLVTPVSTRAQTKSAASPARPGLVLTTPAFEDCGIIPAKYTQSVSNPVSFGLEWTNVPPDTKSFLLMMHDPEVAKQRTIEDQLHWLVINIPGDTRQIAEAVPPMPKLPNGSVQAKNGAGDIGYRGPGAAAAGPYHHYTLVLFALDTRLDLDENASRADALKAMNGHILGKAVLVGRYHR